MATNNVNVRSGPGTNYPIYGSLPSGRSAILIGRSQDSGWFVISMNIVPLGQGWVSAQFATANGLNTVPVIAAPPVPPSADFGTVPGPNDPQATALVNTFVRSGPAPAFPAFGIAQPGRTALVIGKSADNKYWAVRVNPANIGIGFAWVDMPSVSAKNTANVPVITSPPPPPTVVVPTPPAGAATGTAMDYLNIRSGPGTNFPVLGTVAPGTTGEIIGKSADGQWWQFRVPVQFSSTGTGWASAGWVAASNTANVPVVASPPPPPVNPNPPPPPSSQCVIVSQSPVNGTTYRAGTQTQFTVTWTVRNTSGSDWNRETDIAFVGALNGVSFHQGPDLYDISNHVSAGGTYTFSITAVNPSAAGTYQENWAFVNGSTTLCPISIRIVVQ